MPLEPMPLAALPPPPQAVHAPGQQYHALVSHPHTQVAAHALRLLLALGQDGAQPPALLGPLHRTNVKVLVV
jgi:hypothetical protein